MKKYQRTSTIYFLFQNRLKCLFYGGKGIFLSLNGREEAPFFYLNEYLNLNHSLLNVIHKLSASSSTKDFEKIT